MRTEDRDMMTRLAVVCVLLALWGCGQDGSAGKASPGPSDVRSAAGTQSPGVSGSDASDKSPLPLPLGYYALNSECGPALRDRRLGVEITPTKWRTFDRDYDVLPVARLGLNRFSLGGAARSVRQASPRKYLVDEGRPGERQITWCAREAPRRN